MLFSIRKCLNTYARGRAESDNVVDTLDRAVSGQPFTISVYLASFGEIVQPALTTPGQRFRQTSVVTVKTHFNNYSCCARGSDRDMTVRHFGYVVTSRQIGQIVPSHSSQWGLLCRIPISIWTSPSGRAQCRRGSYTSCWKHSMGSRSDAPWAVLSFSACCTMADAEI